MAFEDKFRLSSHAVITNDKDEVLLLKANYAPIDTMGDVQQQRIKECLAFSGYVASAKF